MCVYILFSKRSVCIYLARKSGVILYSTLMVASLSGSKRAPGRAKKNLQKTCAPPILCPPSARE